MPDPQDFIASRPTVSGIRIGNAVTPATVPIAPTRVAALASGDAAVIERELAARPVAVQTFAATFDEVRKQGTARAATFSVEFAARCRPTIRSASSSSRWHWQHQRTE